MENSPEISLRITLGSWFPSRFRELGGPGLAKSRRGADDRCLSSAHRLLAFWNLAAWGVATGFSAGLVIGIGAAAGAGLAYGIYRLFRKRKS